jgi:hypothetical protein
VLDALREESSQFVNVVRLDSEKEVRISGQVVGFRYLRDGQQALLQSLQVEAWVLQCDGYDGSDFIADEFEIELRREAFDYPPPLKVADAFVYGRSGNAKFAGDFQEGRTSVVLQDSEYLEICFINIATGRTFNP